MINATEKLLICTKSKAKISVQDNITNHMCTCRYKNTCPLNITCKREGLVYKAEVENEKCQNKEYFGCIEGSLKKRKMW